jgi:hypothetical protein
MTDMEITNNTTSAVLQQMMSKRSYEELQEKVKELVGEGSFDILFPAFEKALVNGGREEREHILNNLLDMESCRVCTTCGKIMSKGWYLNDAGYACSDECAAKSEGITMEEFKRYKIYKKDLEKYLIREGKGRKLEDLSDDECDEIINDEILDNVDWYYTEWCDDDTDQPAS